MCEGGIQRAWNLNNNRIYAVVVVVVVVIMATHAAAFRWVLRNMNCLLRGELVV
jgi:hypothetical protein